MPPVLSFDRLMVIIPDRLSDLTNKGEVTERYYNPGNLFKEVHLVLVNDDQPDPIAVQKMVGDAKLAIHNVAPGPRFFHRTLGWQPWAMRNWAQRGIDLAKSIAPSVIRTHGNFIEGWLAAEIKDALGIPYVVSLHGVWDRDMSLPDPWKETIRRHFRRKLEERALRGASVVIAVYKPIIRYALARGASDVRLIYNAVSSSIATKNGTGLATPARLITVNRQQPEKNPENIIRAVADLDVHYTIIGHGPYHEHLKTVARDVGAESKVEFIPRMSNADLCQILPTFDIAVSHCDYWGISKGIIEACIAGLPIVLNHHPIEPIPDCEGDWLTLCPNTPDGYRSAIVALLTDDTARDALHRRAVAHAERHFNPIAMEKALTDVYRDTVERGL